MDQTDKTPITSEEAIRKRSHRLKRKKLLIIVSALTLIVALSGLAYAWYTRTSNTYALTFKAADFDYSINKNVEEICEINMYSYSSVSGNFFAPGAYGWIPVELSAEKSDVDVYYEITVTNSMPRYLGKRMRYFYYEAVTTDEDGNLVRQPLSGNAFPDTTCLSKNSIEACDTTGGVSCNKVYLDNGSETITGDLKYQTSLPFCIYWEWYFNADEAAADWHNRMDSGKPAVSSDGWSYLYDRGAPLVTAEGFTLSANGIDYNKSTVADTLLDGGEIEGMTKAASLTTRKDYEDNWNDIDTEIGRFTDRYKDAFIVYMSVLGAQRKVGTGTNPSAEESGTTP